MNKSILLIFILTFFIGLTFIYLTSSYYIGDKGHSFLNQLENNYQGNKVSLSDIHSDKKWDTICFILPYQILSKNSPNLEEYFGKGYTYNFLLTPNTTSPNFGFGVSFLSDGKLVDYVEFPKKYLRFFNNGKLFNLEDVKIQISSNKTYLLNSNVFFNSKSGESCFSKETAYLEFTDDQTIFIGG